MCEDPGGDPGLRKEEKEQGHIDRWEPREEQTQFKPSSDCADKGPGLVPARSEVRLLEELKQPGPRPQQVVEHSCHAGPRLRAPCAGHDSLGAAPFVPL